MVAASTACEQECAPRSWEVVVGSVPLQISTGVHLSVQFLRADEPTCSLAVSACAALPSLMQHAGLLDHDSEVRFNSRPNSHIDRLTIGPSEFWRAGDISPLPGRCVCSCCRSHRFGCRSRIPPTLRWRSDRHPVRRTTVICRQLGSQQWCLGAHRTISG